MTVARPVCVLALLWAVALALLWPAAHAAAASVFLEDLTSPELRQSVQAGTTTVLLPIGGTEQSGPYIVLGKHNVRARALAGAIAKSLGNAVVAPVLPYVPEGSIHPPAGHMKYAGTISVPDAAFEAVLEGAARSFKQHGFQHIVLLGDHGGYKASLARVADRLNREWARDPSCRVLAMPAYYEAATQDFAQLLKSRGHTAAEIGEHAGLADTALSLAVNPSLVRAEALAHAPAPQPGDGINGDPRRATAALGQAGVQRIVERTVAAIRQSIAAP